MHYFAVLSYFFIIITFIAAIFVICKLPDPPHGEKKHGNDNGNKTAFYLFLQNYCTQLRPQRAAGGAELHQVAVSLDSKDVGGFALTLPVVGINLFSCRHIYHIFPRTPRSPANRGLSVVVISL